MKTYETAYALGRAYAQGYGSLEDVRFLWKILKRLPALYTEAFRNGWRDVVV